MVILLVSVKGVLEEMKATWDYNKNNLAFATNHTIIGFTATSLLLVFCDKMHLRVSSKVLEFSSKVPAFS
jgi:hypothetical protein